MDRDQIWNVRARLEAMCDTGRQDIIVNRADLQLLLNEHKRQTNRANREESNASRARYPDHGV